MWHTIPTAILNLPAFLYCLLCVPPPQESVHSVSTKSGDVNKMVIPAVLPKPRNVAPRSAAAVDDDDDADGYGAGGGGAGNTGKSRGVVFKLLSRDSKGRFETRQMQVRLRARGTLCSVLYHHKGRGIVVGGAVGCTKGTSAGAEVEMTVGVVLEQSRPRAV
jgi:hypothetical protein